MVGFAWWSPQTPEEVAIAILLGLIPASAYVLLLMWHEATKTSGCECYDQHHR